MSNKNIIESLFLSNDILSKEITILENTISISDIINKSREKKLECLPFHFNVITSAVRGKLHETGHSKILFDLLHHNGIRQDFIRFFFPNIRCGLDNLKIKKEYGNKNSLIDLVLYNDDLCFIIENKANNAVEQDKQIYRYVYDIAITQLGKKLQQIYVLYLNKDNYEKPSARSVVDNDKNVIDALGERFRVGNFSNEIVTWLDHLKFNEDEKYLISGVLQYKDYIELYCETSKLYTPMHNEIKSELARLLNLNGSPEENLIKLQNQKENIDKLNYYINELITEEKIKPCKAYLSNLVNKLKIDFANYKIYDVKLNFNRYLLIGVGVDIKGMIVNLHIEYDTDQEDPSQCLYYGIICPYKEHKEAYDKIKVLFKGFKTGLMQSSESWPLWEYDDDVHIYDSFKTLVEYAISLNEK